MSASDWVLVVVLAAAAVLTSWAVWSLRSERRRATREALRRVDAEARTIERNARDAAGAMTDDDAWDEFKRNTDG